MTATKTAARRTRKPVAPSSLCARVESVFGRRGLEGSIREVGSEIPADASDPNQTPWNAGITRQISASDQIVVGEWVNPIYMDVDAIDHVGYRSGFIRLHTTDAKGKQEAVYLNLTQTNLPDEEGTTLYKQKQGMKLLRDMLTAIIGDEED